MPRASQRNQRNTTEKSWLANTLVVRTPLTKVLEGYRPQNGPQLAHYARAKGAQVHTQTQLGYSPTGGTGAAQEAEQEAFLCAEGKFNV